MTGLLILIRFVHLGALTLLIGTFAFLLLVGRPAFHRAGATRAPDLERFDRLLLAVAEWSLLTAFASALAWLGLQAAIASGRPLGEALTLETVGTVLTGTNFGRVWEVRLALIALLAWFLFFREHEQDDRDWTAVRLEGVLLAGGLAVALTWAGHAAATTGRWRLLHQGSDALHLLAVGVWLGGLCPLAVLLRWAGRSPDPSWTAVAREATRRFSLVGLGSVAVLVLTGLVNTWTLVGSVPRLVGTPYGRLLLLKLALLLPLIGIAAVNLLRLKPTLLAPPPEGGAGTSAAIMRRLARNVIAEAGLGAAVLLVVGALGITPPALHAQPTWPFAFRLSWEVNKDVPGVPLAIGVGVAGALLGAAALGSAALSGRLRPWAIGAGLALWAGTIPVPLRYLAVDAYPTTYLRTPIPYNAISIASGQHLYQQNCAVCHGAGGYGDGPVLRGIASTRPDLTAPHTALHTAGDLFWWLTHGIPGTLMPPFQGHLTEQDRWDLINFLRALSAAEQARTLTPLVEPTPWCVAPDFTFGSGVGAGQTLKDFRGRAIIHLVLFTLPGSLPRLERLDAAAPQIGRWGARTLAVPMRDAPRIYRRLGARAATLPLAVEGSEEIVETYALFRRTLAAEGVPPVPSHMEFLVDRQGYLRARWIPGQDGGWEDLSRLLHEIGWLDNEAPKAAAPDEHVH